MGYFLIFLCFVGSYLLFVNRNKDGNENIFLSLLFLLNGIQGFNRIFIVVDLPTEIATLFFMHLAPLSFLIGPILYFYIKKLISPEMILVKKDWIHILPSLFFLIVILPYNLLPYEEKTEWVKAIKNNPVLVFDIPLLIGPSSIYFIMRPMSILFYIIMSLKYIQNNHAQFKKRLSFFQEMIMVRWIQIVLISFTAIYVSNFLFMVNSVATRNLNTLTIISLIAGFGTAFLCIQLFINPYILFGFNQIRYHSNDSLLAKLYFIPQKVEEKFTEVWAIDLENKILTHDVSLAYLKKGYSIKNLAEELAIPLYQLNYYFKEIYKDSFSNWKNIKRIEYATKLLKDDFLETSTLENLSSICGYSSRANFNEAFKMAKNQNVKSFLSTMKKC
jgi:AraC-like DNA-binding protein